MGLCARSAPVLPEGSDVVSLQVDVRDAAAMEAFAQRVEERFGTIDLWINNAGVLAPMGPLRDLDAAAFRDHVDTNLTGVFLGSQVYVRHLRSKGGGGALINISSGAAWNAYAGWTPYCASKAAVERLTECLALEEAGSGLRAYSVAPGVIDTAMQEAIRASSPEVFPESERFLDMKVQDSFNSVGFVAGHLLELAFDPARAEDPVAQRLPDEKG